MTHRAMFLSILAFAMGFGILPLGLSAQSSETQSGQTQANPPRVATPPIQIAAIGCLKRGPDGYYLTDRDGNTWQLSSTAVDLSAQVMHAVMVTGKPGAFAQSQPSGNQPGSKAESGNNPSRPLQVLTLKMLSNSCTR
jgi:hypothetical protein